MRSTLLAIPCLLAIAAGTVVAQGPERADAGALPVSISRPGAVITTDSRILSAIDRLSARSGLWRDALSEVAALGRQILIMTPDRVVVREATGALDAFDGSTLAEVAPVTGENGRVNAVMVVLNVALLDSMHARLGSSRHDFEADLERVLAHEVYGHAIPYLLAGSVRGHCPDPRPGEAALDACSIRRENAVRKEAGLGQRSDYEIEGLALGRRLATR